MGFKTKTEKSINETWQQWISFTLNAWNTLHYDMNAFENMPEEDMFGEFINRIILRYAPQAHCSFSNHLHEYRKIADEYNANLNEENKKQLIECLIKANRKTTDTTDKAHKKLRIYLQKDVKDMLTYSEDDKYYGKYNIKDYLEAVLNEYVSLPYYQRERIYFQKNYNEIKKAISKNNYIILSGKKNSPRARPLRIETDKSTNYNYLIYTESPEGLDDLKPMRLHHIRNVVIKNKDKFKPLTKDETQELKDRIEKNGPAYIHDESKATIKVKLTKEGKAHYNSWINQRPDCTNKPKPFGNDDEDTYFILEFDCSETQINNYFFKFGAEAEILEPQHLRESFAKKYKMAYEKYTQE